MSAASVRAELTTIRLRTRKAVTVSAVAHLLLLLVWVLNRTMEPAPEGITEITWIEASELAPPAPPARVERQAPPPLAPSAPALPAAQEKKLHFAREETAESAPKPQELAAVQDRLRNRLTSLQREATDRRTQLVDVPVPTAPPRARPAGLADAPPVERTELARSGVRDLAPVPLARTAPSLSSAPPTPARIREARPRLEPAPPAVSTDASREVLAGVTLSGPVVDRDLVRYRSPEYPDWAKREAVEGSVRLHFVVLPDGTVKENVLVQKTSGFEDFDRNATIALLDWKFEPLTSGAVGDQWGTITLNYRLAEAH